MPRFLAAVCLACVAAAFFVSAQGARAENTLVVVHAFNDVTDGDEPVGLVADGAGNIYGVAATGGVGTVCQGHGCGTVFKIAPDGTETVLHTFSSSDGSGPLGIVFHPNGNIYGTTVGGGKHGFGTVFELTPSGREKVLFSFNATHKSSYSPHGIFPQPTLIVGPDGTMYGTTQNGGVNSACHRVGGEAGCGTVYKITPDGVLTTLYAFGGQDDGCDPRGGLVMDKTGNLYGTTQGCGRGNYGTVFKLDSTGRETILHMFSQPGDGATPVGTPILDGDGNLYGGTMAGGTGCPSLGCGIVYKIAPDGTETILYSFQDYPDGAFIYGSLYRDKTGNLYGTTQGGGAVHSCNAPFGCGIAFKLAPDGTKTDLHVFLGPNRNDGAGTYFGLVTDGQRSKQLYGSTAVGPGCCGMIYEIRE
ncbi:MAG TPA: choice-of-anchor tandem repeat GloVer-containing protein [Rhizomicrobium sp.]|nr:choice-of-anchor tandem repeat GloVer-containing protein [Rhizomicrobium sp.]